MSSHWDLGSSIQPNPINPTYDPERTLPTFPAHSASSIYDSPSPIGDLGIPRATRRFSNSNTRTTPAQTAAISAGQLLSGTITSPHESLVQPIQEKERLRHKSRRLTIGMLSEDLLLEIFDFCRLNAMKRSRAWESRPWKWLRLAHVCRRWRHVISMSPRRLDLQIYCKSGASIKGTLAAWGTLPLIVRYKGSRKSLPKNIATALCHPDRVREIDLDLTSTTVGSESVVDAIKKPFQTLERIQIAIKGATRPSLPSSNIFLGGSAPRLTVIALDGINFPSPEIKQVISSTNNLVELRLQGISKTGYFSADALVTALSTSTQLRELEVSFLYPASLPTESTTSPPLRRTTFPSLRSLSFHGASEYLEEFASRVDLRQALNHISIYLFNQIVFEIPQICRSIPFTNSSNSTIFVDLNMYSNHVEIRFMWVDERGIEFGIYSLNTLCKRLDWQLSFVTQVLSQLPPLLKSGETLNVSQNHGPDIRTLQSTEDVDSAQWLEFFQPFTHVRKLSLPGKFALDILQALLTEDMDAGVLPELTLLYLTKFVNGREPEPGAVETAEQFIAARKLSGRTIDLKM